MELGFSFPALWMWTENGIESYPLLTAVGRCLGFIKCWLSGTSVSAGETHLSFLVLTPLPGREAPEGLPCPKRHLLPAEPSVRGPSAVRCRL